LTTQNTKEINNTNQISETNKNNKMNNKEVIKINVIDDDNETGTISLADGFKKRKSQMIEKMKNRIKINNNDDNENNEINNSKTKKNTDDIFIIEKKYYNEKGKKKKSLKGTQISEISNVKSIIKEPSPDLILRLSQGEKVNLSKKEIKNLNNRLVSNLPENKFQEKEERRKESQSKRSENVKFFTQKLKEEIINKNK